MNPTKNRRASLGPLAVALALGMGLGTSGAQAQSIIEVGGAGTIGDTTLTTANVPNAGANWTAAGDVGFVYSGLVSPVATVTATGPVTLTFDHRYFIEPNWDGGTVFVSVNGAPAAHLEGTAFTANGYDGDTTANNGSAWITNGEEVFFGKSEGYDTPALIQSIANLGTLNAGDTVSVEFRGGWDGGYQEPGTDWEIGAVKLTDAGAVDILDVNFTADGTAGFTVENTGTINNPWTYLREVSRFELDADTQTADRYVPTAQGTNIDLTDANISVEVLTGTLDPGDTFSLFDLTGGTTLSGTPGMISVPSGTWDTSNLAVDGTIVCVQPFTAPTPPPVTDGMIVWLPADGVNTSETDQVRVSGTDTFVKQWNDYSGNGYNATNATENDQPTLIANALNGRPVLRFGQDNQNNGDRLYLGDLSADFPSAGSVFVVSTIDNDGRYNLFGNRNNDERWVADTWNESRPGSFRQGRSQSGNFTKDDFPTTGSHVFVLESDSAEFEVLIDGESVGTDSGAYNSGSGQNWTIGNRATNGQQLRGDIAEVILYNRILTEEEANQVGGYLMQKYRLTTSYPPLYLDVILDSPADGEAYPSGEAITASAVVDDAGTPPYTVEFFVDGASAGTATSTDPYTLDLGVLADGNHEIYAVVTDSATPTPGAATSATHTITVAPATDTTTTLVSSANPSVYGSATLTATVVANNASTLSGGTVQFYDGGVPLGDPVTVDTATGEASYDINLLGVGTHEITADYSGDGIYTASSASAVSQVVNKAELTVTATSIFRPTETENLDPLPYKITGYQNGEDINSSGVAGEPLVTTTAVLSSPAGDYPITCEIGTLAADNYSFTLVDGTLTVADVPDTFSVNFYANGALPAGEPRENLQVDPGMPAGLVDWFTNGWANIVVPWNPGSPQPPVTLTSNRGSSATFTLITCRNGGPYVWNVPRTTLLGDGNGNMMDAHVNSTEDSSEWFDMEVTEIPFANYDVIFYMGVNQAQFNPGTGNIVVNGGATRKFTLKPGAFDGTFVDMVDETTPGNYMLFEGLTGDTLTVRTWGDGFCHTGPTGFQIRVASNDYATWADNYPDADLSDPGADFDGDGLINDDERLFGLDPTDPASLNPVSIPLDAAAGTLSFTRRSPALTGKFSKIETSTDLVMWTEDTGATLAAGDPVDGIETVAVELSAGLLSAPKLFVRVVQDDGLVFATNFEEGDGGFAASGTPNDWAYGTPNADNGFGLVLTTGNGGSANCWGTVLGTGGTAPFGGITTGANSILQGPDAGGTGIDLTNVSAAQLQFAAALDASNGDTVEVLVKEVGTGNVLVTVPFSENPLTGDVASDWTSYGPYDITDAAGKNVYLEFRFVGGTDDYLGLYVDDISVNRLVP